MRVLILIVVVAISLVLVIPYYSHQGLLYWQSKQTQAGQTVQRCNYISGLVLFEVKSQYESWAGRDRICEVLVSVP